ncbi:MAG: ribonuclease III [Eubacteriales bacterium]|nr:ribonuclease III [Eubacteriales bacterium]
MSCDTDFTSLYKSIGFKFNNEKLLKIALTHPSYSNENHLKKNKNYQRFEYFGDSILSFIVSEYLFLNRTDIQEGALTEFRANLVCENSLSDMARKMKLSKYIFMGKGAEKEKTYNKNSILCDVFEALICAIYLDQGLDKAKEFVYSHLINQPHIENIDYKTILQEYYKENSSKIKYTLIKEEGLSHDKKFTIAVYYDNKLLGMGIGKSKKNAEKDAAHNALLNLKLETKNVPKID